MGGVYCRFFGFLWCIGRRRILQSGDNFILQTGQGGDETQCLSALHQLLLMLLQSTAKEDAKTPAAPLMPQNQAVGLRSTAVISRIPLGKPNPIRKKINGKQTDTDATAVAPRRPTQNISIDMDQWEVEFSYGWR